MSEDSVAEARETAAIDRLVGQRIKARRLVLGLTQEQLADRLGLSYQQIQKYETGANRVAASRLFLIARELGMSISQFFDGDIEASEADSSGNRAVIEINRAFARIEDVEVRGAIVALVKALARAPAE